MAWRLRRDAGFVNAVRCFSFRFRGEFQGGAAEVLSALQEA
jgi:hypothetical protein